MALTTGEIRRIRSELGYNTLDAGAGAYIGVTAVFDQVIATYLTAGASTTSATAVTAATTPTPVTLTLTSATGFSQFDTVWVDVDSRMERATVARVSGSTIVVELQNVHSGTYPVTVDGGEAIVREHLAKLADIAKLLGGDASASAGIQKVDEIEFFGNGTTRMQSLIAQRDYWRLELASVLGVEYRRPGVSGGSQILSLY